MAVEGKLIEVTMAVQAAAGSAAVRPEHSSRAMARPRPPPTNRRRLPRHSLVRRAPTNGAPVPRPSAAHQPTAPSREGHDPAHSRGVGLAPVTGSRGRGFLLSGPAQPPLCWSRPRPRLTHAPTAIAKLLLPGGASRFETESLARLLASSARRPPRLSFPGRPCPGGGVYPVRGGGGRVRGYSGWQRAGLASGPGAGSERRT